MSSSSPDITSSGFDTTLGLELVEVSGDEVVGRLPVASHLHQPYGIVHGGVYCSVVETTASVGGATWLGDRGSVVGTSNHTNFLRAVREGVLEVRATPVHRGRTQQLWTVRITDEAGKLVAQGEVRLANVTAEQIGG
ncbi:MAG: thioesterase [Frankiales bacterium]|nr:thioesterase [Frankiales bacterium]